MPRAQPAPSPDRQGAGRPDPAPADRRRWTAWGTVSALFIAFATGEVGHNGGRAIPGTEIPSLLVGLFVMPAGGILGFAAATLLNRRRLEAPTDIDPTAARVDAPRSTGTD